MKTIVEKIKDTVIDGVDKAAGEASKLGRHTTKELEFLNDKKKEFLGISKNKDKQNILNALGAIGIEVHSFHLDRLKEIYVPLSHEEEKFSNTRISCFNLTKWVTNPEEKNIDKLVSVYQMLQSENCNIALIYDRHKEETKVSFAIVNTGEGTDTSIVNAFSKRIKDGVKGNFPGSEIKDESVKFDIERYKEANISIVSNIPSEKSEDFLSQTMEKLLDGIVPKDNIEGYTIILLATPIKSQIAKKSRIYELYSELSPYSSIQINNSINENKGVTSSATGSVNVGFSSNVSAGLMVPGAAVGASTGFNAGLALSRTTGVISNVGGSKGETVTKINFAVEHTMQTLKKQIERLEESTALGMWEFAAYVLSDNYVTVKNVSNMYLSLTQGEKSFMSQATVNTWSNREDKDNVATIYSSLTKLKHPEFILDESLIKKDKELLMYPTLVNATTALSGKELARALNFPRKSVSGLPVFECYAFGRDVQKISNVVNDDSDNCFELGKISHMRQIENTIVSINKNNLSAHTFITGSTGSGKSNTIYKMLHELTEKDVKFMVIEPAKGEYKNVFGGRDDVTVYGTNPYKVPNLLQVNPFSFPEDIHVLEHIDRLVEIFNACWPMYAAMPAILKDAIEQAYEICGWNLVTSKGLGEYPSFETVLEILPQVVESSNYSSDTSSDYKGALTTRVRSLTKGISGRIFENEISLDDLFNKNVIIDLSRVGSNETKSLIMGILVLKLQEFRMSEDVDNNSELRHVTVLEEAHNLLRRTSLEQSQESSNLQGKSVEMIANAIAEMRTYGEGFIIADQSPGLMDMSVIRNTNTKIIMRLPDESDRQLVGKSAGLTDNQIIELSRLDTGVAAIYQNSWLEPVLCKVDKFEDEKPMKITEFIWNDDKTNAKNSAIKAFLNNAFGIDRRELTKEEVDLVRSWYCSVILKSQDMQYFNSVINNVPIDKDYQTMLIYSLCKDTLNTYTSENKVANYVNSMQLIQSMFEKYGINTNDRIILQIQENFKQLFEIEHINIGELTNLEKGKM